MDSAGAHLRETAPGLHSQGTIVGTVGAWKISDEQTGFGARKLAMGEPHFGRFYEWAGACAVRGVLMLAVVLAVLLIFARPAMGQTESVLYNFCAGGGFCTDGSTPWAGLVSDAAGNLYGTTRWGGRWGGGTVFELSPNGNGGWTETVLHSFTGGADGEQPWGPVMLDSAGNVYGTTAGGGAATLGVVFELSPAGGSWTETVLYNFCTQSGCTDGGNPLRANLIMAAAGNLCGMNSAGVFELSPSGGGWTEQVIYNGGGDARLGGLTMDAAGNIFGTTTTEVFELSPSGAGGWNATVMHTFAGAPGDGSDAVGLPTLDSSGNLYGTTIRGGAKDHGTVYELTPGENGEWTEQILHSFKGGTDGAYPWGGVALDAGGNLYGTTAKGGKGGTVFELAALGNSNYEDTILWVFNGKDGAYPAGTLMLDGAGNLYGTTGSGGAHHNQGVVFEVSGVRKATTTTLMSAPNPSTYGEAVTFTAVISGRGGEPPDGETVTFMTGKKTVLGTGTLSGGSANFTSTTLKVGTTSVTAVYGGDANFSGSASNVVKQVVKKAK